MRVLIASVLAAAACCAASAGATDPPAIAALGDSITRGFNAGWIPFHDGPSYSWATGTHVLSPARRLGARAYNDARDGARMRDLPAQAALAVRQHADHVLILIGANDLCHGRISQMTSVGRFRADFETALTTVAKALPQARVELLSIPDLYRVWQLEHGRFLARTAWRFTHACPALLARPTSTAPGDVARRALVRGRELAFNRVLGSVCAGYPQCRFDGGAVFGTRFGRGDISSRDYFHPSRAGQARLAEAAWAATFTGASPTSAGRPRAR